MCGREGGSYFQGTTRSDRLRGRRVSGATRFPWQSPGLDCLARLRAPTIRPRTRDRCLERFSSGHALEADAPRSETMPAVYSQSGKQPDRRDVRCAGG